MKKNIILWLLLPLCSWGQTITNHKNAVVHSSFRIFGASTTDASDATKALISIQYMDGLGRPLQTVGYRQSPLAKDIVFEGKTYDSFGRPYKTALTAPTTVQTGEYQANPSSLATTFYGDSYSYGEITAFDNSPLNRLRVQYGPGQAWRTNTKNIQTFDEIAGTTVRLYNADLTGNITLSGTFTANSLYKTRVIDEQGNTTVEIKDKSGNLIQREQPVGAETLITYYVYDDWQRLRAVIQPEGYALNASITKNSTAWNNWVFGYTYDAAGRVIEKHTPGGGWQYIVYDKNDRPVLTQDASQTALSKWSFTKYDAFGRTIINGELDNASSRATLQTSFDGMSTAYETWLGVSGYSNVSFPISYGSTAEKLWNFYDSYEWIAGEWAFNSGIAYSSANYYSNSKGLQSGSFARNQETPSKVFHSVFYYDFKGRMMQSYRVHDKGGATPWTKPVITNLGYNFAGEVTNEKVLYQVDGLANTESLATYEYDNTGRRLQVSHGINTAVSEVSRSDYDEAGRLKQSKIRATGTYTANGTSISGLQTTDYAYHVRGQLRGINLDGSGNPVPNASQGDLFSYKLDYETAGYYDGNIGKQYWQASTNNAPAGIRTYTFTYDAASRLKTATYSGIGSESYGLPTVNYDRNGNITSLQRNGKLTSTYGLMDNLTYTYAGNRLMRVEDGVTGDYDVDFVNRNSGTDDYTYQANGALKSDKNEAINDIIYSTYVNQPIEMQLTSSRWIKNSYDGAGRLYKTSYSTGEYWEYLDGMVFKNGAFYQLATPEGRAVYQSGIWSYEYVHTDHLGNTRVAYKANGTALTKTSETSFDPWGIVLRDAGLVNAFQNRFEYQNKEKESTFNLRRIDFGARSYNGTIGRFDRVDLLAHAQSNKTQYHFVSNNPINRIDPTGLTDYIVNGKTYTINDGHNNVSMNVSQRQFDRLQRRFDAGGSGYERTMNRLSDRNGFTTSGTYADNSSSTGIGISITHHKAGSGTYGQWSIQNNHQNYGTVEHIARVTDAALGSVTGQFGNINLGSNGSIYFRQNSGAIFRGNQYVNVTSAAAKYSGLVKGAKWGGLAAGVALGGYEIYQGVQQDGGKYGYNAQIQTAGAVGGLVGGYAGAEGGAAIGAAFGVWFGGVGAVPGAIIGGLIGGAVGAWGGDYYGEQAAKATIK